MHQRRNHSTFASSNPARGTIKTLYYFYYAAMQSMRERSEQFILLLLDDPCRRTSAPFIILLTRTAINAYVSSRFLFYCWTIPLHNIMTFL